MRRILPKMRPQKMWTEPVFPMCLPQKSAPWGLLPERITEIDMKVFTVGSGGACSWLHFILLGQRCTYWPSKSNSDGCDHSIVTQHLSSSSAHRLSGLPATPDDDIFLKILQSHLVTCPKPLKLRNQEMDSSRLKCLDTYCFLQLRSHMRLRTRNIELWDYVHNI